MSADQLNRPTQDEPPVGPPTPTSAYWYGEQSAAARFSATGPSNPPEHPDPAQVGAARGSNAEPTQQLPLAFQTPTGAQPAFPSSAQAAPPRRPGGRRFTELASVAVLAAVLASGGTWAATRSVSQPTSASSQTSSSTTAGRGSVAPVVQADPNNPNWTETAAAVSPSVVAITARSGNGGGEGSGVIIDSAGHILTNNHVVAGAQTLTVTLSDGHTYAATIKGTDPSTDLAVVALTKPPKNLTPIAMGDSSTLKVGDPVMAVGNPLGLAGTVTTGIVSALDRPVRTESAENEPQDPFSPFGGSEQGTPAEPVVTNAIQTSAAINPGNSGGALVNGAGQLVGINSAIASLSSSGGQSGNIGIGFAIPVNEARQIADQLIASGTAQHAYLGVTPVDGEATIDGGTITGAKLQSVGPATPAADAGLKVGDVITAVDGRPIDGADALVGAIRAAVKGQVVTLTVLRDGTQHEITATLAVRPTSSE